MDFRKGISCGCCQGPLKDFFEKNYAQSFRDLAKSSHENKKALSQFYHKKYF